jgi:hypothetical protein
LKSQKVKGINPEPIKDFILKKVLSELSKLNPKEENINSEINKIFERYRECWPTETHERLNDTYYNALQSVIYPRNINGIKKSLIEGEVKNKNILVKKILEELLRLKPDNKFLQGIGQTIRTNVRESIPSSSGCKSRDRGQTEVEVKALIRKIENENVGYKTLFNRLIDLSTTFESQNKDAIEKYVSNLVTMLQSEDGPKTENGRKYFEILRQITIANLWHIEDKDLLAKNNNRGKTKKDKDFVLTKLKELRQVASNKFKCFAWNQAIPQTIASDAVRRLPPPVLLNLPKKPSGRWYGGASSDISVNQLINEIKSHGELKERFEASVNKFENNGIKEIARKILEDKYIKNNKQNKISELPDGYEKNILTLITAWITAYYKQKLLNCAENISKPNSCPTDYKELEEIFRSQYILNSIDKDNLIGCILKRVECMKAKVKAGNLYRDILVNFEELLKSLQSNSNKNTKEELFIKTSNYLYTCINTTKNTNKFKELQIYLMILKEKIFPELTINAKAFDKNNCKKIK